MFHQDVRSSGTWKVQDGVVIVNTTTSTDKERRGQVGSFRVRSITPSELVAVDYNGQVRQEWKAPLRLYGGAVGAADGPAATLGAMLTLHDGHASLRSVSQNAFVEVAQAAARYCGPAEAGEG